MDAYQRVQMARFRHELEVECQRAVRAAVRNVLRAWDDEVDVTDAAVSDVMADIEALRPPYGEVTRPRP